MLMNSIDVWAEKLPFIREWVIGGATRKFFQDFSEDLRGKVVIEIGCGNGAGAKVIKNYFALKKVVASDLDPRLVAVAKNRTQDSGISFEVADATKLPYKDNSFDAAFEYITIHHISAPNWNRCIDELHRVLKTNGKLFVYDVAIESFDTFWGRLLKKITIHPYDGMFTRKQFEDYITKVGFKILKKAQDTRHFVIVAEKR